MTSRGPQTSNASNPSVLVVKEAGSPALRGTVNLILNLSKTGDSLAQVPDQPAQAGGFLEQTAEPVHRVRNQRSPNAVQSHHDLILCCTRFRSLAFTFSPPPPFYLPQHTVPHFSAYKSFWRRCQGLLGNTLGSLMRKKRIYRQRAREVKRACAACV